MTKSELDLRAIWDANGVPKEQQDAIIADVEAKAKPGVAWDMACAGYADAQLTGESDLEYSSRLDAKRVTAEFNTRSRRRTDGGRTSIEDSPLFGGQRQKGLFDDK